MHTTSQASYWKLNLLIGSTLLIATAFMWQTPSRQSPQRGFSAGDVSRIEQAIKGVDRRTYRIVLPVFSNGRVVGSKTYGTLPMSQVRLVASARRVVINERGNLQLVMDPNEASMSSGASTTEPDPGPDPDPNPTNGPNSMHPTSTGKLNRLLDDITRNIDRGQFVFLKSSVAMNKQRAGIKKQ